MHCVMDFDLDGLFNVHKLQQSKSIEDQKRLIELVRALNSPDGWQLCASVLIGDNTMMPVLHSLPDDQRSAIAFLCCRVIEEFLKSGSVVQDGEGQLFSAFIWKWIRQLIDPVEVHYQKYITSKASQLICLAVVRYYPKYWPTAFHELLSLMADRSGKDPCSGPGVTTCLLNAVDLFLDTLINLDSFLVSRDVQLTTEELTRANEVKDYMRETCITALMNSCYHLVHLLCDSQLSYASHLKKLLTTVGLMASWVDLHLVGSAEWIALFGNLLQASLDKPNVSALVRCGVYSHLVGLVSKGMPPTDKINFINGIWDQLGQLLVADPLVVRLSYQSDSNEATVPDDDALSSLRTFAMLVDSCGLQLIGAYRNIHCLQIDGEGLNGTIDVSSNENQSLRASTLDKIEDRLTLALHLFGHEDEQVSQAVVPFLRSYVALVKGTGATGQSANCAQPKRRSRNRNSSTSMDSPLSCGTSVQSSGLVDLNQSRLFVLKRLLFAVVTKMKALPLQDSDNTDEEDLYDYRHDLRTLVCNLIQLDAGCVLEVIHQLIRHAAQLLGSPGNSDHNPYAIGVHEMSDIDVALSLFYLFGESCKAPKNDHFAPQFYLRSAMASIMDILCSDSFSHFPHWALQLQYFELMARYERYFHGAPEHLLKIMVAFLDHRGLRSQWRSVRVRCAYLITPLIKSHRKTLVPHTEQLLAQFADLLQLPSEPDASVTFPQPGKDSNGVKVNNSQGPLLGITETSFLYEAAAQLIAAGGAVSTQVPTTNAVNVMEDRVGQLFRMLLDPVFVQYNRLLDYYISETDSKLAESRGRLLKQAADLITRTSRIFSQPKSVMTPGCQAVLCDALQLMLAGLSRFPSDAGAPGRAAACAGVRAFLHRMVACLGPVVTTEETADSNDVSEILLAALIQAVPQLVHPLQLQQNMNGWLSNGCLSNVADAEQRWREMRDVLPLVTQVILRYKNRSATFLAACLPGLFTAIIHALEEPLSPDHLVLVEERKLLRRGYLQLLQCICQSLPPTFVELLRTNDLQLLSSILSQTEACIDADDPLGLRSSLLLFVQLIQSNAKDSNFYQSFLLAHLVPFCVLAPTRSSFRLADAQFGLALNEIGNCLFALAQEQPGFCTYLQDVFLPEQQLSNELIQSYVGALKTESVKNFHAFLRNFYAAFR